MERQESSIGDDMFKYVNRPDLTDDERDLLQNTIELAVKLHFEEVKIPESQSEEILTEKELIERETQSLVKYFTYQRLLEMKVCLKDIYHIL